MEFKNAKYTLDLEGNKTGIVVEVDGVQMSIPISEGNRHYRELIAAETPIAIPKVEKKKNKIPDLNAKQWSYLLNAADVLSLIESVLDSMPKDDIFDRMEWAALKATVLDDTTFSWERVTIAIQKFEKLGVEGIPSENELLWFWNAALELE